MYYSDEFKKMLEKAKEENIQYIGTGNPNAQILIIGKELAFDKENNPEQAKGEIENNIPNWEKNVYKNLSQEDVSGKDKYNPLYLYKNTPHNDRETWGKYQKLMNLIRDVKPTGKIDFQEYAFITEYNINPSKKTCEQDKVARTKSIKQRDEFFKTTEFFQQFPIVIVAASNYAGRSFGVELTETFKVEYKGIFEIPCGKRKLWFSLHYSPTKIVVHTRQLSGAIKNDLLQAIAKKVREFAEEKGIKF